MYKPTSVHFWDSPKKPDFKGFSEAHLGAAVISGGYLKWVGRVICPSERSYRNPQHFLSTAKHNIKCRAPGCPVMPRELDSWDKMRSSASLNRVMSAQTLNSPKTRNVTKSTATPQFTLACSERKPVVQRGKAFLY